MTATLDRRKEVLELAREHNFLILEGMIFTDLISATRVFVI
jgi:DNA-binding transcriptional MocR family regulator